MNDETPKGRSKSIAGPFMPIFERHDRKDGSAAQYTRTRYNSWTDMLPIFLRGSNSASSSPVSPSPLQKTLNTNGGESPSEKSSPKEITNEKDTRQGPLETDLFWLVLNDMGEPK